MYKLQDWAAVQRIYRETKSIRATARLLDMVFIVKLKYRKVQNKNVGNCTYKM